MEEAQVQELLAAALAENTKTVLESVEKMVNKAAANTKRDLSHFKTDLETFKTALKPKEPEESDPEESTEPPAPAKGEIKGESKAPLSKEEPKPKPEIDPQTDAIRAQTRALTKELNALKEQLAREKQRAINAEVRSLLSDTMSPDNATLIFNSRYMVTEDDNGSRLATSKINPDEVFALDLAVNAFRESDDGKLFLPGERGRETGVNDKNTINPKEPEKKDAWANFDLEAAKGSR
jgi:hypothetical protein